MKTPILALVLALTLPLSARAESELKFLIHGKPVKTLSQTELEKLVPAQELTVWEPHEAKEVKYKGFPANALLDKVYGNEWRKIEDVLFTCTDGYQPSIAVERFLKYDGLFAFERVGTEFMVTNTLQANEKVTLGPYYLAWNSIKAPELKAQKGEGWPYQVTTVDLVDVADRFPHMTPPAKASAAVKRGFAGFRQHCFSCHAVNGDGGNKSIDLNKPVSVTEYWKEKWLKRWILNPTSLRPGTLMPSFGVEGKAGEKAVDEIVAYLKAMAPKESNGK